MYFNTMNRKIIGATPNHYEGIDFKSNLERTVYKTLKKNGFSPEYEKKTFTLMPSFQGESVYYDRFYDKKLKKRVWGFSRYRTQGITYTPDFTFTYKGRLIVIEAKGYKNDTSPIYMKLFRYYMETHPEENIMFFEVYTEKETIETIKVLNEIIL